VQELLGHESIETTAIYTHYVHENIKRVYRMHHPRENESFVEVNDEYMERIGKLYRELLMQRVKTKKERAKKRRYYERKKAKKV
jgi:hypothetical protein